MDYREGESLLLSAYELDVFLAAAKCRVWYGPHLDEDIRDEETNRAIIRLYRDGIINRNEGVLEIEDAYCEIPKILGSADIAYVIFKENSFPQYLYISGELALSIRQSEHDNYKLSIGVMSVNGLMDELWAEGVFSENIQEDGSSFTEALIAGDTDTLLQREDVVSIIEAHTMDEGALVQRYIVIDKGISSFIYRGLGDNKGCVVCNEGNAKRIFKELVK